MEPDQRIDVAVKSIFSKLLLTMESCESGFRENRDVECLHNFRVALRRTRALLHQLKGVIPEATINRFKREFDWLRNTTGPARDMDVYLLSFDKFASCLPDERQHDILPLFDFIKRYRQQQHHRVLKVLDSRRYRKIMDDWRKTISKPVPRRTRLVRAGVPVLIVADLSIWQSYKKVMKKGKRINPASPASSLHELRKKCKNLRYLIECFQQLYPGGKIRFLINNLKNLQNNLGEFQDLEVQQYFLNEFMGRLEQQAGTGMETLKSIEMLINKLKQRGQKVRKKFATKFNSFNSPKNKRLYRKLFEDRI